MDVLTMKELLETGVHFGHRTRKWNPKMARYIFTERKGIHIIDLEQTVDLFREAYYFVRDNVANGGEVVFVGTKKQVQATIAEEAQRCGAHYVNRRWLGGTLTNFGTIKLSIDRMKKMEGMIEDGTIDHMPNKEASRLRRRLAKLQRNLDGLRHMEKKPSLMYVIDPDSEAIAVHEANLSGVPVIAIVDTNCDPDPIDFLIPGNDDAIKATKLITARIADAILEAREGRQDAPEAPATTQEDAEVEVAATDAEEVAATEQEEAAAVEGSSEPADEVEEAAEVGEAADELEEAEHESEGEEVETSEDEETDEQESEDEESEEKEADEAEEAPEVAEAVDEVEEAEHESEGEEVQTSEDEETDEQESEDEESEEKEADEAEEAPEVAEAVDEEDEHESEGEEVQTSEDEEDEEDEKEEADDDD